MTRPDFSDYVVHFTKDVNPLGLSYQENETLSSIATMNAKDRLYSILEKRLIEATPTPWFNLNAVCFTECTWSSLLYHAQNYSYYGIGFSKELLFKKGGGPVMYLRPDLFEDQKNFVCAKASGFAYCERFATFLVPFVPEYAEMEYIERYRGNKSYVDFTHEREWRLAGSLKDFSYDDISFVIIANNEDLDYFGDKVDYVGIDKFLIMKNYEQVEKFWPLHVNP